jgi:hypothetical protein
MAVPDERTGSRASATPTRPGGSDLSAANPQKLMDYATTGSEMLAILRAKQTALHTALEALRPYASSQYVPSLEAIDRQLDTLIADWEHLDTFVGDVGQAFADANQGDNNNSVLSFGDALLAQVAHVGYANREEAIQAAEDLAADMQAAIDNGDLTTGEMEALAERAARGQHDPAFAVTFANEMGVDGMVAIAGITGRPPPGEGGRSGGVAYGWTPENLAIFGMLLTTAMDTRRDMRGSPRRDPDNENLPDDLRLDDEFVTELVAYDGDEEELLHYSELVVSAELPADVLKRVGNHQLDDMLTGEPTTNQQLEAGTNILDAIGANEQASFDWLRSDDIAGDGSGTTNMQLLLEYRPEMEGFQRRWQPPERLGDTIATVVDNGLQYPDERSAFLFETTVATVASEGEVHFDGLLPVLGEGSRTHIGLLAQAAHVEEPAEAGAVSTLDDAAAFLEIVMEDDDAARDVYLGTTEHVQGILVAPTGENFHTELQQVGGLVGLVTQADVNAAQAASDARIAARQSFVDGVSLVTDVIGAVPVGGDLASAAINLGSTAANQAAEFGMNVPDEQLEQDLRDINEVRDRFDREVSAALASYEITQGTWDQVSVRGGTEQALLNQHVPREQVASMDLDFFEDGAIKPYRDMSDSEREAFVAWLRSDPFVDVNAVDLTVASDRMQAVIDDINHG